MEGWNVIVLRLGLFLVEPLIRAGVEGGLGKGGMFDGGVDVLDGEKPSHSGEEGELLLLLSGGLVLFS